MRNLRQGECAEDETSVALGIFDGVHLGHQSVIREAVRLAEGLKVTPAVFTFKSSTVTSKGRADQLLSEETKLNKIEDLGIEYVYCAEFDELKDLTASEFVDEILYKRLHAKAAICGKSFSFGKGGKAGCEELKSLCANWGIQVTVVPSLELDGQSVSSTRIRGLIADGEISAANRLLGYRYGYTLRVEHGFERGRTWDFPTINQTIPSGLVLPRFGVYCAKVLVNGRWYIGVTNIGVKPTVGEKIAPLAETFIVDYEGDLYGKEITIELYEFVRPEKTFDSFDELKAEIARNTEFTKKYFGE